MTSYYYDQWLRLWMLGETALPTKQGGQWKGKFEGREAYRDMLDAVFHAAAGIMSRDAVIYVRTDAREFTRDATIASLRSAFPGKDLRVTDEPFRGPTQTALFGDAAPKPGEVDIIMA